MKSLIFNEAYSKVLAFGKETKEVIKENAEIMPGDVVTVSKLGEYTADELGVSDEDYQAVLAHEGKQAKILSKAMEADEEHGYYDIEFVDDGYKLSAIADYHFN